MAHYDREKSKVKDEALADFIANDLQEDVICVPGVGTKTAVMLKDAGIETSFQLVAKFLSFKGKGKMKDDMCEDMYQYLANLGVGGYRSGITTCLQEKVETMIPEVFADDDDE